MSTSMQDAFKQLVDQVKEIISGGKLTKSRLISVTPRIIKFLQALGVTYKLSGQEKKELFFDLVKILVKDSDLEEEEKQDLLEFTETLLPMVVDAVVFAYKSEAFKEIKKRAKKCLTNCCKN